MVASALDAVAALPHVVAVSDPYDAASPMLSPDGRMGFSTVTFDTSDVELAPLDEAEAAVAPMRDAGLTVEYSGLLGDADAPAEPKSELIGMGVAVVVLVLAFGSLVAMSLPLGVALISLLVGTSTIGLISGQIPIPASATLVGSMLGLGVGIDYALFVLARHRENIGTDVGLHESVGRANATAGLSVLFAGSTVVLAIAGLQLAGVPMIAAMGWTSALMVAVTMLAALTLLPALLGLSGKRIDSLRVVRSRSRDRSRPTWSGRWANHVADHPVRYLVAAVALLGVVATPAASLRIGFPDDGNVGTESTLRRSYDMLAEGFGPGFNGPLQVVVDLDGAIRPRGVRRRRSPVSSSHPGHQLGHAAGRQPRRRRRGPDRPARHLAAVRGDRRPRRHHPLGRAAAHRRRLRRRRDGDRQLRAPGRPVQQAAVADAAGSSRPCCCCRCSSSSRCSGRCGCPSRPPP